MDESVNTTQGMDKEVEILLQAIFELGLNRGLGHSASASFAYLQWQDVKAALLKDAPSITRLQLVKRD